MGKNQPVLADRELPRLINFPFSYILAIPGLRKSMLLSRLKNNKNRIDCLECNVGDWFILTQISKNVDPFFYDKFMGEILSKWRVNQPNGLEMQGLMNKEDV